MASFFKTLFTFVLCMAVAIGLDSTRMEFELWLKGYSLAFSPTFLPAMAILAVAVGLVYALVPTIWFAATGKQPKYLGMAAYGSAFMVVGELAGHAYFHSETYGSWKLWTSLVIVGILAGLLSTYAYGKLRRS